MGHTAKKLPAGATQHKTAGPYSPVLEIRGDRLIVLSGQAPVDQDGNVVSDDFGEQVAAVLENCRAQLETAGCTMDDVFKCTVYLDDLSKWGRFNEIYLTFFPEPRPVRTAIQAGLLPGFQVEVELWAAKA